jgi:HNH endonuclease
MTPEAFDTRLSIPDARGCRIWQGFRNPAGYGRTTVARGVSKLAHRLAWELAKGPIPEGICVCHKCDVPACCEVSHLFLGTHADNSTDRVSKGRQSRGAPHAATLPSREEHSAKMRKVAARGESQWMARLTERDIVSIREMLRAGEYQKDICRKFGVSQSIISEIKNRKIWAHVP